jgi:hypothetical protein
MGTLKKHSKSRKAAITFTLLFAVFSMFSHPASVAAENVAITSDGLITKAINEKADSSMCDTMSKELDDLGKADAKSFEGANTDDLGTFEKIIMDVINKGIMEVVDFVLDAGCDAGLSPTKIFSVLLNPITLTNQNTYVNAWEKFSMLGISILAMMTFWQLFMNWVKGQLTPTSVLSLMKDTFVATFVLKYFLKLHQDVLNFANVLVYYIQGVKIPFSTPDGKTSVDISLENVPNAMLHSIGNILATNEDFSKLGIFVYVIFFIVILFLSLKPLFGLMKWLINRVIKVIIFPFFAPFTIPFLAGPKRDVFYSYISAIFANIFGIIPFLLGFVAAGLTAYILPTVFGDSALISLLSLVFAIEMMLVIPEMVQEFMQTGRAYVASGFMTSLGKSSSKAVKSWNAPKTTYEYDEKNNKVKGNKGVSKTTEMFNKSYKAANKRVVRQR